MRFLICGSFHQKNPPGTLIHPLNSFRIQNRIRRDISFIHRSGRYWTHLNVFGFIFLNFVSLTLPKMVMYACVDLDHLPYTESGVKLESTESTMSEIPIN
jgi:hypothetical protein